MRTGSSPVSRTIYLINRFMQVKIFINNKLYKTVPVDGTTYEPNSFWPQIQADKEAGLLSSFNVNESMAVRFETVK